MARRPRTEEQRAVATAQAREWRAKNRERANATARRSYAKNRDRILASEDRRAYKAQWARDNPGKVAAAKCRYAERNPTAEKEAAHRSRKRRPEYRRDHHLRTRYGISLAEKHALLDAQDGCAICGTTTAPDRRGWVVDHDHNTGKMRGILCNPCNIALGMAKDDPSRLDLMAQYVRHHAR